MVKNKVSVTVIILLISLGFILLFSSCAKKPASVSEEATAEAKVEEKQIEEVESVLKTAEPTPAPAPAPQPSVPADDYHVVKKGECLWWIAEYSDIYNDPFMWPMIYSANKDQIKDPDLIYPDQEFRIPRSGYSLDEIKEFRRSAGAPRPYTPPVDVNYPM